MPLRGARVDESAQRWVFRVLWTSPGYLERERSAKAPPVLDFQGGGLLFAEEDIVGPFLPD